MFNKERPGNLLLGSGAVLAFVGFLDALYLTLVHYTGNVPTCSVLHGCEIVTTSAYAVVWGVPIALPGALYFLGAGLAAVAAFSTKQRVWLAVLLALASAGAAVALVLFYLQLVVLGAICLYCTVADSISLVLFGLAVAAWKMRIF